jgi:hypothetical protein
MDEDEILNARQVAEQNPELDATRRQLFGENYLDDIEQGTGIAQYYTGFGQMPTLDYTPAPVQEVAPVVDVTQPVVDTGEGSVGIGDGDITVPDTGNTEFEQDLIDQGIGVQASPGDPVGAAFEEQLTQEAIDDLADYPITQPSFDDQFQDIEDIQQTYGTPIDIGFGEGQVDPGLAAGLEGPIIDTSPVTPTITAPSGDVFAVDDPLAIEKIDFQTPEQTNAINEAFNSVKDLGEAGVDKLKDSLVSLGGKVKEGFDNTVEIGGKTIDLTKSLIGGAISLVSGIPGVGLLLNAFQPDKYDQEAQGALGEIGMLKTTEGGLTVDKYGKNVQSAFGDYDDYNLERQIDLQEKIDDGTIQEFKEDGSLTYLGQELEDRKEIEQKLNETRLEEAGQEQQDFVEEIQQQQAVNTNTQSGRDEADRQQRDTGVATVQTNQGTRYETSSGDRYSSAAEAAEKGDGGGGGGGGKIVCTMMNESYGFGSFRNKIWLRHSKDLAPEYQKGYHKIFLPLVKLSKNNKVLKTMLEHIAVHRTIDIRQESRGKVHLLGRIYRKILEPICYWVGKYVK